MPSILIFTIYLQLCLLLICSYIYLHIEGKLELSNLSVSKLKTFSVSSPVIQRPYFLPMTEKALQHLHKINKQSMVLSRDLVEIFTIWMTTFHCILCSCSTAASPSPSQGFLMLSVDTEECHNPAITLCCWWYSTRASSYHLGSYNNLYQNFWNRSIEWK